MEVFGRRHETIVQSDSEKLTPVPVKLMIESHLMLAGALVVEQGKLKAALLVEPQGYTIDKETLLKEIWPQVERANSISPANSSVKLPGTIYL